MKSWWKEKAWSCHLNNTNKGIAKMRLPVETPAKYISARPLNFQNCELETKDTEEISDRSLHNKKLFNGITSIPPLHLTKHLVRTAPPGLFL